MDFRIFENLIDDIHQQNSKPEFEKVQWGDPSQTRTWIEEEAKRQAVLLYCDTLFKNEMMEHVHKCRHIDATISQKELR